MLYHISLRSWEVIDEFIPRVPKSRCEITGEDESIPRISLSSSIEGCLTGVPWGGFHLINDPPFENSDTIAVVRVYEFSEENIDKNNMLKPSDVVRYVADAEISQEHWIVNQGIKPDNSYILILEDFHFDFKIIEHKDSKIRVCKIKDIKYQRLSKKGEELLISQFKNRKQVINS